MVWTVPYIQQDFDTDIEDMVINHISTNWGLADPTPIRFRPGFFDYHGPYECAAIQTITEARKKTGTHYLFLTTIPVGLRAKRLTTDENPTKPLAMLQLMEEELQRIILVFRPNAIPGIDRLLYDGYERLYDPTDTYAKSDWSSMTRVKVLYQKFTDI